MRVLITLLLASALSFYAEARAEEYDVYLLAGQSNMDGRGPADDLTAEQREAFKDAIIYYRNPPRVTKDWTPLAPGFSIAPGYKGELPSKTFGPELGFAAAMKSAHPDRRIALIKGSKGGTSLQQDWNPGIAGKPETQGGRYRDFLETIRLAKTELTRKGHTFSIRGLLWHQGESDSQLDEHTYLQLLTNFIDRIRHDVEVSDLPFIVGEVFDNGKRDSVRAAQQSIVKQVTHVGLASARGLTTWDKGTHFDARSQWILGQRFAAAILDRPPVVVCLGDSITNRGYPAQLTNLIQVEAVNAGVGGNTSTQGLRRMSKDVFSHDPAVVVILFGTNDLRVDNDRVHVPVPKFKENLKSMIDLCEEHGAEVVLCTLPPINPEPFFTRHERAPFDDAAGLAKLIQKYQTATQEVANEQKVTLLDLNSTLQKTPQWLSPDGVHPSDEGNQIIAEQVATAIRSFITDSGKVQPSPTPLSQ